VASGSGTDTDDASVRAAVGAAIARHGRIDCLVNNAGFGLVSIFESTPLDVVRRIFETNVLGVMRVTQVILPHFAEQGGGRIVTIGSAGSLAPDPLLSIYTASKPALENFTSGLRFEVRPNVTVKLVQPGMVPGTAFIANTQAASRGLPVPEDYRAYIDEVAAWCQKDRGIAYATEEEVAAAILAAATDEGGPFRYPVGEDALLAERMRHTAGDAAFDEWALSRAPSL
jgi:short-subunit dehydrogenase